ncbi:hypothetical protein C8C99_0925 [Acidovorax sp. 107]|uniref:metal-dependent hydrolase n=1 Tax=Acidovorax sp. 107 TaxID=2135638 RepID=UPI000D4A0D6D|nr:metal-dependent hydrolase [Acidovorax sp. 107]PUA96119.1 hypothetical protein C8C99_0925 [Acidovorax sp. 107]
MPFTPIHLGPGLAFKAFGGRHFSFMVFGGSQVLMDIEPLIGILQNKTILHGYTHTLLGALVIGTIGGIVGRPTSSYLLRLLAIPHPPFTWAASFVGAYIGTLSHVLLDSIMHFDMSPWWPIVSGNQLQTVLSIDQLHIACLIAGIVGGIVVAVRIKNRTLS